MTLLPRMLVRFVALAMVLGSAAQALAKGGPHSWLPPFEPSSIRYDLELFKPVDLSTYGDDSPPAREGIFFQYDRLYWSISRPGMQTVGSDTAEPPTNNEFLISPNFPALNSINTGTFQALQAWGNRWEVGYWDTCDVGWMVSVIDHVNQGQSQFYNDVYVGFDDPSGLLDGFISFVDPITDEEFALNVGKMATVFQNFRIANQTTLHGVELMRMNRSLQYHHGGFGEILYGVRWFQVNDKFEVDGQNALDDTDPLTFDYFNPLTNSFWNTEVTNNLVGPQIGYKWYRQKGRWKVNAEGRFLAAANFINARQITDLGSFIGVINEDIGISEDQALPLRFTGIGTNSKDYTTWFSPMGEWRADVSLQATKAIAFRVGYTGMVVGNVSRAAQRVNYDGPRLVGLKGAERSTIFINGVNFGVEINR